MSKAGWRIAAAVLALGTAAACSSTKEHHGYVKDRLGASAPIEPGVDTKSTVLARLGSPSTKGAFGDEAWYYISTDTKSFAFFKPDTTNREVVAVRFGEDDVVQSVDTFGLERGRVVSYANAETATRGRELTFLEQLLGSIGNSPLGLPGAEERVPGQP